VAAEAIQKLQPNRTMHLRGFDDRGAAASLHSTSASGFTVSGVFRDAADFAVLVLWDRDNFFEHPRLKYLPDDDFTGVVLSFDAQYTGCATLDSLKFETIPYRSLSYIKSDGTSGTVSLWSNLSSPTPAAGTWTKAATTVTIATTLPLAVIYDRVTIWFRNYAFDYIAAGTETAADVAAALESQINGAGMDATGIECTRSGAVLTIRAKTAGADGNLLRIYTQSKTATLTATASSEALTGGSSAATWSISLDFSALGLTSLRQLWLTFAPALADGAEYSATEFECVFSNWTVTGANKALKVAGPGSVRIGSADAWCSYAGASWAREAGFYFRGFAQRASTVGDSVTIEYHCQHTHDLYIGVSLYTDRGKWGVVLDGDSETLYSSYLATSSPVVTRQLVRSGVAAGAHRVTLTLRTKEAASSANFGYFDFVEAAVPSDVPDPDVTYSEVCPANDYGTDHGYKLSPQRLHWNLERLGFQGPRNVYVSVFWWNQRVRQGHTFPSASIDLAELTLASGDAVFVDIGGQVFGCSIFPAHTAAQVAKHLKYFINGASTGVWADVSGTVLTITCRAIAAAYTFTLDAWREQPGPVNTDYTITGSLNSGGVPGLWVIDPTQTPTINRGARDWLADLCAETAADGRELTLAYSMELLNPPDDPGGGHVWAARHWNGDAVQTATGFGSNVTTHCSFVSKVLAYHRDVFLDTADLMDAAGIDVHLQLGEFVWWYFPGSNPSDTKGMAFYDDETAAAAVTALGRALAQFMSADDDPGVNSYEDADFLRDRLFDYMNALASHVRTTYPSAVIELLLPLDVNYPEPYGVNQLGGQLNHYLHTDPRILDPSTAPFDRLKIEGLDFGAGARDHDKARWAMSYPVTTGTWPRADVRYLVPLFNGGCPWTSEYLRARNEGVPVINFWAFDHVCIFGWPLPLPEPARAARFI